MNIEEKTNEKIQFAVVGDPMGKVASLYGMLHPKASGSATVRAVFFIDPNGIIRAILYYPLTNGRNIKEIIRLLEALQKTDSDKVATPANWVSSKQVWEFDEEKVIVGAPLTVDGAKQRLNENYQCIDWYLCFKK
jgi:peroxiredoxin (alkyl hydroperoxide reductase subunit C)